MFRKLGLIIIALLSTVILCSAYTRDWDNTDPIDHTLNSQWPAEIREVMTDVEERLDDIMDGFTSGDTVTQFNRVPLTVQGTDESAVANSVVLYSKDVSSKAELFVVDEDGDTIQITSGGSLAASSQCSTMWPVGSVFISTVSTNPNTLLGCGTWSAFASGRVLVGINASDADFDTAEETGGSKTANLAHTHSFAHTHVVGIGDTTGAGYISRNDKSFTTDSQSTSTTGSGGSATQSIVQPYIVVYMWERTA